MLKKQTKSYKRHRDSYKRSPRAHKGTTALDFFGRFGWRHDIGLLYRLARLARRDARRVA